MKRRTKASDEKETYDLLRARRYCHWFCYELTEVRNIETVPEGESAVYDIQGQHAVAAGDGWDAVARRDTGYERCRRTRRVELYGGDG